MQGFNNISCFKTETKQLRVVICECFTLVHKSIWNHEFRCTCFIAFPWQCWSLSTAFKYMMFVKRELNHRSAKGTSCWRVLARDVPLLWSPLSTFLFFFHPLVDSETVENYSEYSVFGRRPRIIFFYEIKKANNNGNKQLKQNMSVLVVVIKQESQLLSVFSKQGFN